MSPILVSLTIYECADSRLGQGFLKSRFWKDLQLLSARRVLIKHNDCKQKNNNKNKNNNGNYIIRERERERERESFVKI